MIEWFFDSLRRETGGIYHGIEVVVVDFWRNEPMRQAEFYALARCPIKHVAPKPTVWQGSNRLTTKDYFAPANARNTALCHASGEWIAFVDDLSVLMPGWLSCVNEARLKNYIVLGAYKKVKNLSVSSTGFAKHEPFAPGVDSRWWSGSDDSAIQAAGSWLYGCSFAAPVEALLTVNGSDENCDGLGGEDTALGIVLQNAGFTFRYDRRMVTLESEELHHVEKPFVRNDKGTSPNDKSHAHLEMAKTSKFAPNYFGEGGIRALRSRILSGEPFPIVGIPEHDWFDGQPLREM